MKPGKALVFALFGVAAVSVHAAPASAGGGGGGGGGPCSGFTEGDELVMRDNCFNGVAHFSASGTVLSIENGGIVPHTYTAADGSFDTGILQPGESAEISLGSEGVVRVWCTLHGTAHGSGMAGVLLVGDPATGGKVLQSQVDAAVSAPLAIENDPQAQSVSRLEESISMSSRNTTLAVVVVGSLLGGLVVGVNRRSKNRPAVENSHDQSGDQI